MWVEREYSCWGGEEIEGGGCGRGGGWGGGGGGGGSVGVGGCQKKGRRGLICDIFI